MFVAGVALVARRPGLAAALIAFGHAQRARLGLADAGAHAGRPRAGGRVHSRSRSRSRSPRERARRPLPAVRLAARDRRAVGARLSRRVLPPVPLAHPDPRLHRPPGRRRDGVLPDLGLPALPAVRARPAQGRGVAAHRRVRVAPLPADHARVLGGAHDRDGVAEPRRRVHPARDPHLLRLRADLQLQDVARRYRAGVDAVRGGHLLRLPPAVGVPDAAGRRRRAPRVRDARAPGSREPRVQGVGAQAGRPERPHQRPVPPAAAELPRPVRARHGAGGAQRASGAERAGAACRRGPAPSRLDPVAVRGARCSGW